MSALDGGIEPNVELQCPECKHRLWHDAHTRFWFCINAKNCGFQQSSIIKEKDFK